MTETRPLMRRHTGEYRLALAVLGDALARLAGENPEGVRPGALARQKAATRRWVNAIDHEWPFSFESVCAAVGIAADPFRRALLAGHLGSRATVAHITRRVERPRVRRP